GWEKISSNELVIDNKTAYEDVYLVNDTHFSKLMKISHIILVKNDKTYMMLLQAPDNEFNSERVNFDIILNSFRVL
ncbi:MAG: photosystem II reaction center PsbP family protein, partial [Methanobacterium sp.]|nr:photosystem II reaction center PsbP family protein [Methanobacterium sp.]